MNLFISITLNNWFQMKQSSEINLFNFFYLYQVRLQWFLFLVWTLILDPCCHLWNPQVSASPWLWLLNIYFPTVYLQIGWLIVIHSFIVSCENLLLHHGFYHSFACIEHYISLWNVEEISFLYFCQCIVALPVLHWVWIMSNIVTALICVSLRRVMFWFILRFD